MPLNVTTMNLTRVVSVMMLLMMMIRRKNQTTPSRRRAGLVRSKLIVIVADGHIGVIAAIRHMALIRECTMSRRSAMMTTARLSQRITIQESHDEHQEI
jgi:hypothetical protein